MLTSAVHTGPHNEPDLPGGYDVPGLDILTRPASVLELVNGLLPDSQVPFDRLDIVNLRFKTPASCLVTYRLTRNTGTDAPSETYAYARGFDRPQFTMAVPQIGTTRWVESDSGPSVSVLPEAHAILYWFPNDERLQGLRRITVGKKLQRAFHDQFSEYPAEEWRISDRSIRFQILRYKPERRAVIRCRFRAHRHADNLKHERFVFLGLYEEGRDRRLWDLNRDLHRAAGVDREWTVPRPIGWMPEYGMLINDSLTGRSYREIIEDASADVDAATGRAARALAALHHTTLASIPPAGRDDAVKRIYETRDMLARFVPGEHDKLAELAERLGHELSAAAVQGRALVHGDLHPGQIILGDGPAGLVDFDRAHVGEPAEDLGNFNAQIWINYPSETQREAGRRLIEYYRSARVSHMTDNAVNLWTAVALYHSALRPVGRLESGWRARITSILNETERLLP